jgi:hypothetical protein
MNAGDSQADATLECAICRDYLTDAVRMPVRFHFSFFFTWASWRARGARAAVSMGGEERIRAHKVRHYRQRIEAHGQ